VTPADTSGFLPVVLRFSPDSRHRPAADKLPSAGFCALTNRILIIVSREQPTTGRGAQYEYLKHLFEKDGIGVIVDRRVGERRRLVDRARPERSGRDRRRRDTTRDLQRFGWAMTY